MSQPNISFNTADWSLVEQWLGEELMDSYKMLSNKDCSDKESDQLRGRIMFIQRMLDFRTNVAAERPLV